MDPLLTRLGGILAIGLFVVMTYFSFAVPPIENLNDKQVVPSKRPPQLIDSGDAVDSRVIISDSTGRPLGEYDLSSGELYQSKDQAHDPLALHVEVVRPRYLISQRLDLGTYAGYITGTKIEGRGQTRLETGLRISPVRLFWGTTAPDLLIGRFGAGFGVSLYPPPEAFGHYWNHLGVGGGYEWDYDHGKGHLVFPYLSTSIRF